MTEQTKTVLIIDDDETFARVLSDALKEKGYTVYQEHNGEDGVKSAIEHKPNLVLLDIIMPKVDGIEALKKLREHEDGKGLPVLMLTQLEDMKNISEALTLGVKGYIVKSDWGIDATVKEIEKRLSEIGTGA